jgi:hypothetical protein
MIPTIELLEAECKRRNWDMEMITALAWVLNRVEIKKHYRPSGQWEYMLCYRNKSTHRGAIKGVGA